MRSILLFILLSLSIGCSTKEQEEYVPVPYTLSIPTLFEQKLSPPYIPSDNPLTVEGIALGKKLFFDPILSGTRTQSCAHCHRPQDGFSHAFQFSEGANGDLGTRNSMPLFNNAWNYNELFTWDGKEFRLENQAF